VLIALTGSFGSMEEDVACLRRILRPTHPGGLAHAYFLSTISDLDQLFSPRRKKLFDSYGYSYTILQANVRVQTGLADWPWACKRRA
jgi:hypothetical protein